ncbi:hypothetical protein Poly30_01150 [Planctomycetes bacterium Poly30]|uniref:Uncharacterized protein n=1 Tax=Saltatorellus ferox TaxID=2528018 RepID=A0A518EKK4_9BACT|nr:hypothetical protein Poly30_01150 [Planctomycetes bacterium Poly30]
MAHTKTRHPPSDGQRRAWLIAFFFGCLLVAVGSALWISSWTSDPSLAAPLLPVRGPDDVATHSSRPSAASMAAPSSSSVSSAEAQAAGHRSELVPAATLVVQVTARKFAVPNRRVSVDVGLSDSSPAESEAQMESVTDRAGIVRFEVPAGLSARVEVSAGENGEEGPARVARRTVVMGEAGTEVRIRLELHPEVPAERITVLAKSIPHGVPIVGARVSALREVSGGNLVVGRPTRTDAGGMAEMPWADGYTYEVTAPGYSPRSEPGPSREGETLHVRLVQHARLHGQLSHAVEAPEPSVPFPRITLFLWNGRAAAPAWEFVDDLTADGSALDIQSVPPENVFDERSGLIRPQARLDRAGRWEISSIPFPRTSLTATGALVRFHHGDYGRVIASDLILRAGDDLLVHDSWRETQPANLRCVDSRERSLDLALDVCLQPVGAPTPHRMDEYLHGVWATITSGGHLKVPYLPRGTWSVVSFGPDVGVVLGSIDHQGADEEKLVVDVDPIPPGWRAHVR